MAPWLFTEAISSGKPIQIFNNGEMFRDFTYIDDIVDGVYQVMREPPSSGKLHRVLNIGHGSPVSLLDFVGAIESALGSKAVKNFIDMQPGDVRRTYASTKELQTLTGYKPRVGVEEGVKEFVNWYAKDWMRYLRD